MFHERLVTYLDERGEGAFTVAHEAEKFLAYMRERHPDELDAWLDERVTIFVAEEMRFVLRSERQRQRQRAGARAFAEAAAELGEHPTAGQLDAFKVTYCVNARNEWKPAGEMNAADCNYVAGLYETRGNRALMLGAFHRAVAARLGERTVEEVFTRDEYTQLLDSFTR